MKSLLKFALGCLMAGLFCGCDTMQSRQIDFSGLQSSNTQYSQTQPLTYVDQNQPKKQTTCVTKLVFGNYITTCE